MSDVLTIKQIPRELKKFWAEEARRNARSINTEIIQLLQEERNRREIAAPSSKNMAEIMAVARRLQSFRIADERSVDDLLYDEEGMPK